MPLTTFTSRTLRRRAAKATLAGLGALALGGAASAPAHADWIYDVTSGPSPEFPQFTTEPGLVQRTGPGRCDMTLQFRGGSTTAVMFAFTSTTGGEASTGWSPWLRPGDTWSLGFYGDEGSIPRVWKAQADRSASVRLRVTGSCYVPGAVAG